MHQLSIWARQVEEVSFDSNFHYIFYSIQHNTHCEKKIKFKSKFWLQTFQCLQTFSKIWETVCKILDDKCGMKVDTVLCSKIKWSYLNNLIQAYSNW